jgi:hypothetical protein
MQTITGNAGIASGETMGAPETSGIIQGVIVGATGIPSEEDFSLPTGIWTSPEGMPYGRYLAH